MVAGLKLWLDKNTYYIQTNNPTEEILKKEDGNGFLETCGPTSATTGVAGRGSNVEIICPGNYKPQPEEVLNDFFHDPNNYPELKAVRADLDPSNFFNNRVPQDYEIAIPAVFGIKATFEWKNLEGIYDLLRNNIAVMLCFKKPGHYIVAVAYNKQTEELCYRDPWPNNPYPSRLKGQSGFNRWVKRSEIESNLTNYRVLIGV